MILRYVAAGVVAFLGLGQFVPDVPLISRVAAVILFAVVFVSTLKTNVEVTRVPATPFDGVITPEPAEVRGPPIGFDLKCADCHASFADISRGLDCTNEAHHGHATFLLEKQQP